MNVVDTIALQLLPRRDNSGDLYRELAAASMTEISWTTNA